MCQRKKIESKLTVPEKAENENTHQSPLANVCNPINLYLMPQQCCQYLQYQNYSIIYSKPRRRFNQWKPRENCYFCYMPCHSIRECQEMKLAKEQRKQMSISGYRSFMLCWTGYFTMYPGTLVPLFIFHVGLGGMLSFPKPYWMFSIEYTKIMYENVEYIFVIVYILL